MRGALAARKGGARKTWCSCMKSLGRILERSQQACRPSNTATRAQNAPLALRRGDILPLQPLEYCDIDPMLDARAVSSSQQGCSPSNTATTDAARLTHQQGVQPFEYCNNCRLRVFYGDAKKYLAILRQVCYSSKHSSKHLKHEERNYGK